MFEALFTSEKWDEQPGHVPRAQAAARAGSSEGYIPTAAPIHLLHRENQPGRHGGAQFSLIPAQLHSFLLHFPQGAVFLCANVRRKAFLIQYHTGSKYGYFSFRIKYDY